MVQMYKKIYSFCSMLMKKQCHIAKLPALLCSVLGKTVE